MLARTWREGSPWALWLGLWIGAATRETVRRSLKRLNMELPYDPAIARKQKHQLEEDNAALFTIAQIWNRPQCRWLGTTHETPSSPVTSSFAATKSGVASSPRRVLCSVVRDGRHGIMRCTLARSTLCCQPGHLFSHLFIVQRPDVSCGRRGLCCKEAPTAKLLSPMSTWQPQD